jgi:hypothetical protein
MMGPQEGPMTSMSMMRAAGIVLACLALACGRAAEDAPAETASASGSGSPQGQRDTCALLTPDDIQSVMGATPGPPRIEQGIQCSWPSADGSNQSMVGLIVTGNTYSAYDEYAEAYRQQMDADPADAVHRIEGGPGQFTVGYNDMAMVQIYSGSSMVQVSTFDHDEKHALALARRVVARLN